MVKARYTKAWEPTMLGTTGTMTASSTLRVLAGSVAPANLAKDACPCRIAKLPKYADVGWSAFVVSSC